MPVASFDTWTAAAQVPVAQPLKGIGEPGEGPVIGIDAAYYLDQFRFPAKEPLVTALGGFPMYLETVITKEINELQSCGVKVYFYFDGMDSSFDDSPFSASMDAMATNSRAFGTYEQGDAIGAIDTFKQSGFPNMQTLFAFLKTVLHGHDVPFVVAPFRAHAQMVYHLEQAAVDALFGSSELFMYGATRIITKFTLAHDSHEVTSKHGHPQRKVEFSAEKSTFTWIELDTCLKMLGDISQESFVDALFLAGSSHLESFPPLKDPLHYPQPFTFRNVVDLLATYGGNIFRLCDVYSHDARLNQIHWEDRYMRALQSVRHMIVLFKHDVVKPRSYQNEARHSRPPSDLHELIGLAMPEELQYYTYRGMIGPRVMNWLISGKIKVFAPYAGGESKQYRTLVKEQLQPWRKQALALLAFSINRYFQQREITTSFWFGAEHDQKFNVKDLSSPKKHLFTWRVNDDLISQRYDALKSDSKASMPSTLYFSVKSLVDRGFASKTVSIKPNNYEPLESLNEIVCNVIWRFLYLRGYVDKEHQLTHWGKVLCNVLDHLHSTREQAEAAFVAIELLRLDLLKPDSMFTDYGGAPTRGSTTDQRNCLLVSRLACCGKMGHPAKGYSGPLSRHLLAYHSLVSEVRTSLRDLVEMTLAVLFLEADGERIRDDLLVIAETLPFRENFSGGLGVLTKTYLDEVNGLDNPFDKAQKQATMAKAEKWLIYTDVSGSFKSACRLWDAVQHGVAHAEGEIIREDDKKLWAEVDRWLAPRRL